MSLRDALLGSDARATRLDAEIRAELDHHLELAAEALREEGFAPAAAEREARRRFGDYDHVRRACLRANLRGTVMLRRLHAATTILLFLSVLWLVWVNAVERERLRAAAQETHERLQSALAARETPGELVLEVGDRVTFVDPYNPELATTEEVALDGHVLVPGAGWIPVAGLSRPEAERTVTEALRPYYREVDVKLKVER